MEKIALGLIGDDNQKFKDLIIEWTKDLDINLNFIDGNSDYEKSYEVGRNILTKKDDRAIIIDNFGTLPFMVIGKMKGTIVAQISDEYSAHMTSEHNGADVLVIGSHLTGLETIKNIVRRFIKTPFAAGRHLVRTDMLDEMLKQERDVE